jgi:hypothetical protein
MSHEALENLLHEDRVFPPTDAFAAQANASASMYDDAAADRLAFWAQQAARLDWAEPFTQVLDWSGAPFARWFVGGRLNVAYNCVDRHVESGHGDQVAIRFEGEPGDRRDVTYAELQREVSRAAHALAELGVTAGDRVAIYMPMIPEAVVAMLACARVGAPHSVVFAGFSAEALRSRIDDAQATLVITADGQNRRGSAMPLKPAVDEAVAETPSVRHVLVVKRTGGDVEWTEGRDVWWHDIVDRQPDTHAPEAFDSEHPLFILYTSGTTGKPKGILHTSGGYLTQAAYTHSVVFDLKPDNDVYWCTADIGWVTGHSYIVYGPLANRVTQVIYEGTPDTPAKDRFWDIVERHRVSIYSGAHGHPNLHEVGRRAAGRARPVEPSTARLRRRADQPRGVDVVPLGHRRRSLPDRRHLVADRDRRHHDLPAARRDRGEAGLGDASAARRRCGGRRRRGQPGGAWRRRLPRPDRAVACDAARHLGRRPALCRHLLVAVAPVLLRGRRREAR